MSEGVGPKKNPYWETPTDHDGCQLYASDIFVCIIEVTFRYVARFYEKIN